MNTITRNNIAEAIIAKNWTDEQFNLLDKISSNIYWSWENWEDDILQEFYEGEKPEDPTEAFIKDFCYNEDFEETYGKEREQDLAEWFAE